MRACENELMGDHWEDQGGGYGSLVAWQRWLEAGRPLHAGAPFPLVAYVALPSNHPLVGRPGDKLPGGGPSLYGCQPDYRTASCFTVCAGNVFGWSYEHADVSRLDFTLTQFAVNGDVERALAYFRECAS